MPSALDDRTVAYVVEAQPVFEDLRQVAAQLAGLLVLAATGSKEATPDHPMLHASTRVFAQANDGVNRVGTLVTDGTRHHYRALVAARESLTRTLACADAWPLDVDAVLDPLRQAYAHLQDGSRMLPGFPIVSFDQGCCAVHVPARST
jgi:hypothetical protein